MTSNDEQSPKFNTITLINCPIVVDDVGKFHLFVDAVVNGGL